MIAALLAVALQATFPDQPPPPPPDYAKPASWAARPGAEGKAAAVPIGATPVARAPKVDVFYVHPTTYRSAVQWNQDITDAAANAWTDDSVVQRQASAFNGCCRVYAPRYRQASTRSFASMKGDGGKAFELAYHDVLRAFDRYLAHDNHGRPFILVGHSQGASHLARLIEERIDGTSSARRMVAAYLIGFNLSEGDFPRTYRTIPVCATPSAVRCIVQWNAVLPTPQTAANKAAGERRFVERYGTEQGKTMLCVNPLTFDRSRPAAGREESLGAVPGDPGMGPMQPLRPQAVAARCEGGVLVVDPDPALGLKPLPGGSMHYHDIGLFYADVRADAIRRADAFTSARAPSSRAATR